MPLTQGDSRGVVSVILGCNLGLGIIRKEDVHMSIDDDMVSSSSRCCVFDLINKIVAIPKCVRRSVILQPPLPPGVQVLFLHCHIRKFSTSCFK